MRKRQFQVANAKVGKKWKYSRNRKKKKKIMVTAVGQ